MPSLTAVGRGQQLHVPATSAVGSDEELSLFPRFTRLLIERGLNQPTAQFIAERDVAIAVYHLPDRGHVGPRTPTVSGHRHQGGTGISRRGQRVCYIGVHDLQGAEV